jgi:hypothetical protein
MLHPVISFDFGNKCRMLWWKRKREGNTSIAIDICSCFVTVKIIPENMSYIVAIR